MYLADSNAKMKKKTSIDKEDILEVAYEDEEILKEVMDSYKYRKILINLRWYFGKYKSIYLWN